MIEPEPNPLGRPRQVALYREVTHGWYAVFEYQGDRDNDYHTSYVRVSAPAEVRFTALENDEAIRTAVASLEAAERQLVDRFQQNLSQVRAQKANLLALTHQPKDAEA